MNITIIAAIFMSFFRRILGTRKGLIVAGIGIFTYTILVGGDAAVVRAAIMGALTLLALRLGRQTYGFASLSAAATIMTAIDPNVLWDVGFQLSFAATLGLMLFTPPLERWFTRFAASFLSLEHATNLTKPVSEFALYTIAAQLMTLPLSVAYFQQLSLTSFIANPVILPAQPLLMITGGIATIAGMIWIPLGRILAMLAWAFQKLLRYLDRAWAITGKLAHQIYM
jgi:competence protein ComEC